MTSILTFAALAATIALIALRPRGLNEGIAAPLGAVAMLAIGTATPSDIWRGVVDTAPVLIFLVAMMVVATIAQDGGCFEWAAERAIVLSRRSSVS